MKPADVVVCSTLAAHACQADNLRSIDLYKPLEVSESNKMANQGIDQLFDIRTAFLTGNYQQCINEAPKLKVNLRFVYDFD